MYRTITLTSQPAKQAFLEAVITHSLSPSFDHRTETRELARILQPLPKAPLTTLVSEELAVELEDLVRRQGRVARPSERRTALADVLRALLPLGVVLTLLLAGCGGEEPAAYFQAHVDDRDGGTLINCPGPRGGRVQPPAGDLCPDPVPCLNEDGTRGEVRLGCYSGWTP